MSEQKRECRKKNTVQILKKETGGGITEREGEREEDREEKGEMRKGS